MDYLRLFSFSITLFGYGIISLFVTDKSLSQVITIPYRALILFLSILLLGLGYSTFHKKIKLIFSSNNKLFAIGFLLFIFFYSVRFFYDVLTKKMALGDTNYYLIIWLLITLIPSTIFLFINFRNPKKYLLSSQYALCLILYLMFSKLSTLRESTFYQAQGRLSSEALNPISLGMYSGTLILIAVYCLMNSKEFIKDKFSMILNIFSVFGGVYFLVAAASRGPLITTSICVVITIFLRKTTKKTIVKSIAFIFFAFLVFSIISPFLQSSGYNLDRLSSLDDDYEGSRKGLAGLALNYIFASIGNFLVGYGVELEGIGYPHNILIESFLSLGIFGGSIFLYLCLVSLKRACELLYFDKGWGWMGILFIFNFIMAAVSGSLYSSSGFWYFLVATNYIWLNTNHRSALSS